eukprot:CAMPEP_0119046488 /NCGR_PEP_ID=MMETSP1177-20130426/46977_1 /TAXON_ID=2985 /ORGANISM="Ochromonas sp, Strain CCMP1899" /LENGTH=219 /DNA_ID=CAMNT_0007019717 /DNA_START=200 /DNA_END=859 /DNA_ORIENTATION=-
MLKDITPEDIPVTSAPPVGPSPGSASGLSGSGLDLSAQSEMGKLRTLPGFNRLKKQLIVNLMTAHPDLTQRNVRIYTDEIKKGVENGGPEPVGHCLAGKEEKPKALSKRKNQGSRVSNQGSRASIGSAGSNTSNNTQKTNATNSSSLKTLQKEAMDLDNDDSGRLGLGAAGRRPESASLDRETVKNISRLIVERDVAAKKAKLKLEEAIVRKHMESKNA